MSCCGTPRTWADTCSTAALGSILAGCYTQVLTARIPVVPTLHYTQCKAVHARNNFKIIRETQRAAHHRTRGLRGAVFAETASPHETCFAILDQFLQEAHSGVERHIGMRCVDSVATRETSCDLESMRASVNGSSNRKGVIIWLLKQAAESLPATPLLVPRTRTAR